MKGRQEPTKRGNVNRDGQPVDTGDEFRMYGEHYKIIRPAGDVVDCPDCGQPIPEGEVVGCPDGAEICRECFDLGRH